MAEDPPTNSSHAAKFTKSTKKYRIKKAVDRLSALHDSLLHQILSLLDTKEVIRTCVLSKRWRFLWTDSSSLVLRDTGGDAVSFALSVGRILLLCDGIHLNKLSIQFMTYQPSFDASVTTWVQFAIKNRIKDFTLLLTNSNQDYYKLPQSFYSNSSLTDLTIGSCPIAPRRSIAWGFLKNLKIVYVGISQRLVQKILKGCPVLEILQLTDCGGYRHLKVRSPNLTTLVISGWMNYKNGCCLMISAPYLRVLSVSDEWPTRCFVVGDFPSLVKAKVDYKFTTSADVLKKIDSMRYPNLKQSLESFSSVKELELGPWCVEVLSRLEEKSLRLSSSTRSHLTLTVWKHRTSIGGILNILKSSPNLESLVIQGTNFEHHLICDNQLQDNSSDLVLRALKTANISGFSEAGLSGEPLLTLVKLLLKSATNLEKMVIDATTVTSYSSATPCSVEFSKFKQKLFSFPRSSPKAIVVIR